MTAYPSTPAMGMAQTEAVPSRLPGISWGAILGGAVVALAIGLMLNVLGAAVGTMLVDATAGDTPDASSLGLGAGVWLLISNLIGLGAGGYVAARLSGTGSGIDATLHGVAVWAASFLISAVLLGNLVAGVASTAASGVSGAIGGIVRGAGSLASAAGEQAANRTSTGTGTGTVQAAAQQIIERAQNALSGTDNTPAAMSPDQRKAEMATLVGRRVTNGNLSAADRDRLNALVAAEYNISPQDAQQRVTQTEQQIQQSLQRAGQRAREAADAAARSASIASFSIFLTMLLGLVVAISGARWGNRGRAALYGRAAI